MQFLKTGNDYSVYNEFNNYLGMIYLVEGKEYWADIDHANCSEFCAIYEKMLELNKGVCNNRQS